MNCWHCGTELIWGGDHDCEDNEEFIMVTNLSCPNCQSFFLVYLPETEMRLLMKQSGDNRVRDTGRSNLKMGEFPPMERFTNERRFQH